jgi:CHAD domain-containing protein
MLARIEQGGFETLPHLLEVLPLPTVLRSRQSELNHLTATQAAHRVLQERLFEIEQYGLEDHTSSSDVLHSLRIAFKRMRYSADFFASEPTLQIRLHAILTISKEFQEVLGQLHDADVTQQTLLPMLRKRDSDYGVLYSGVKEMFLAAHDEAQSLREDFRVLKQSGKLDVLRAEVVGCV